MTVYTHTGDHRDGHVTDDDVIGEGDQSGRKVWLAVQLPTRTLRSQFHISQAMKVSPAYNLGHPTLILG